jgi:hypothetical protein
MAITIDQVVGKYVETRAEIKRLETELEETLKPLKILQEKRESWLLQQLGELGLKNAKTEYGTVYKARKESVTMAEWDAFVDWVKVNDKFEFLNKAVNKTAVLEMMGEERDQPIPPGVNYVSIQTVNIRKS